jgi:hypothetical protein
LLSVRSDVFIGLAAFDEVFNICSVLQYFAGSVFAKRAASTVAFGAKASSFAVLVSAAASRTGTCSLARQRPQLLLDVRSAVGAISSDFVDADGAMFLVRARGLGARLPGRPSFPYPCFK